MISFKSLELISNSKFVTLLFIRTILLISVESKLCPNKFSKSSFKFKVFNIFPDSIIRLPPGILFIFLIKFFDNAYY